MGSLSVTTLSVQIRAFCARDSSPQLPFRDRQVAGVAALRCLGSPSAAPVLTAVIPAHNEARSIAATIRSLRRQSRVPDRVLVVCDNCAAAAAGIALLNGAEAMCTVGSAARKAGALNQALARLLPRLGDDDQVLVVDAGSHLNPAWLAAAARPAPQPGQRRGAACSSANQPVVSRSRSDPEARRGRRGR